MCACAWVCVCTYAYVCVCVCVCVCVWSSVCRTPRDHFHVPGQLDIRVLCVLSVSEYRQYTYNTQTIPRLCPLHMFANFICEYERCSYHILVIIWKVGGAATVKYDICVTRHCVQRTRTHCIQRTRTHCIQSTRTHCI